MKYIDLYYRIKPLIPRRFQISIRRAFASYKRRISNDVWPITPSAAKAPEGWKGWPDQKKFAFVLTHDVDSAKGHDQCAQLKQLEERLGFKSSFNFVPEEYRLSHALRLSLAEAGFEVGVHGLKHDGSLFRRRRLFNKYAIRINGYLKEWGSVGFNSPSMHHNLEWIADLDIEYDQSTFDTDPFEPQPDGVGTIFPFWILNRSKTRGYVELPYTLPQDHCLFVILKEKDISIWKEKLDWIANNGGVALLLAHPDYMNFEGTKNSREEYPVSHYRAFLEYVLNNYSGQYWHVLPRELARFWKETMVTDKTRLNPEKKEVVPLTKSHFSKQGQKIIANLPEVRLALVCTSGGHFEQMLNLSDFYSEYSHFWITSISIQTDCALKGEMQYYLTNAHFKKPFTYLKQLPRVLSIFRKERPTHILSTGSGRIVFVPFLLSIFFKVKFIHIETFSHVNGFTKIGKLLSKLGYPVLSQWQSPKKKNAIYIGPVIKPNAPYEITKMSSNLVFVTLGTREEPFPRLIQTVETLLNEGSIKEEIIVQAGSTKYESALMDIVDFCPPHKIDDLIRSARYVITQESAGIVTKCLKCNTKFIVMPRDYAFKELPARSDMNEDLHIRLEEMGFTYVVHNAEEMKTAIKNLDKLKLGFRFDNTLAIMKLIKILNNGLETS